MNLITRINSIPMSKSILTAALIGISTGLFAQTDSAGIFLQKGLAEKQSGRTLESMKDFEKAYGYNKSDKQIVGELAASYNDMRRYGQAREKYQQLESLGDASANTYKQLMLLSFNMHQLDDVIKYAQLLKKVAPDEKVAYYIGKANYDKENLGDAIKFLDAAGKEEPQNAEIPYYIARSYADMNNFKLAVPYFQKAIALDTTKNRWIYELGLIYYGMNDDKNALKTLLEAADKGYPKDNEYMENLGVAYLNSGELDKGLAIMKELLQRRPSDMSLLDMVAQAHYDAKKYDEAIGYWDQILALDKTKASALYMIGMSYQKKGEKEKGMALCDKAIQLDPSLASHKQKMEMPGM